MFKKILYSFLAIMVGVILLTNSTYKYFYSVVSAKSKEYSKNNDYVAIERYYSYAFSKEPYFEKVTDDFVVRIYPSLQVNRIPVYDENYDISFVDGKTAKAAVNSLDNYKMPYVSNKEWYFNGEKIEGVTSSDTITSIDKVADGKYSVKFSNDVRYDYSANDSTTFDEKWNVYKDSKSEVVVESTSPIKSVSFTQSARTQIDLYELGYTVALYNFSDKFVTKNKGEGKGRVTFVMDSSEFDSEFLVQGDDFAYLKYYYFQPAFISEENAKSNTLTGIKVYDGENTLYTIDLGSTVFSFNDDFFTGLKDLVSNYNINEKNEAHQNKDESIDYSTAKAEIEKLISDKGYNKQYLVSDIYKTWSFVWRMLVTGLIYLSIVGVLGFFIFRKKKHKSKYGDLTNETYDVPSSDYANEPLESQVLDIPSSDYTIEPSTSEDAEENTTIDGESEDTLGKQE